MMITELGTAPHIAHLRKGTRMRGYRLAPGTGLNATALEDRLSAAEPDQDCAQIIEDASIHDPRIHEALACLSTSNAEVSSAAKTLGVKPRTLQRLFAANALPAPVFWLQLARARRAGLALASGPVLSDIAYDHGYADQAHMNRAFKRFFDAPPLHLIQTPDLIAQLHQAGLATGEQISTK